LPTSRNVVHRIGRTARAGKDGSPSRSAPDEEQDLRAIEKLTRVRIPEGDKSVFDRLPPPQKETPESEFRNARGRMPRDKARREKFRERPGEKAGRRKEGAESPETPEVPKRAETCRETSPCRKGWRCSAGPFQEKAPPQPSGLPRPQAHAFFR
jgi:hypothetical protein